MSDERAIVFKPSLLPDSYVCLQRYMEEQGRLYREAAPLNGSAPEPVVRAQWARDTFFSPGATPTDGGSRFHASGRARKNHG